MVYDGRRQSQQQSINGKEGYLVLNKEQPLFRMNWCPVLGDLFGCGESVSLALHFARLRGNL